MTASKCGNDRSEDLWDPVDASSGPLSFRPSLFDLEMKIARASDRESSLEALGDGNITSIQNLPTFRRIQVDQLSDIEPGHWPLRIGGMPYTIREEGTGLGRNTIFPKHSLPHARGDAIPLSRDDLRVFPPSDTQLSSLANYVQIAIETTVPFIFQSEEGQTVERNGTRCAIDDAEYCRLNYQPELCAHKRRHQLVTDVMLTADKDMIVFLHPDVSYASIVDLLPRYIGDYTVSYATNQPPDPPEKLKVKIDEDRHAKFIVPPSVLLVRHVGGDRAILQPQTPYEKDGCHHINRQLTYHMLRPGESICPPDRAMRRLQNVGASDRARFGSCVAFSDHLHHDGVLLAKSVKLPRSPPPEVWPPRRRGPRQFDRLNLEDDMSVTNWVFMGQQEANPYPCQLGRMGRFGELVHDDQGKFVGWFDSYVSAGPWAGFCRVQSSSILDYHDMAVVREFSGEQIPSLRPRRFWWPDELRALEEFAFRHTQQIFDDDSDTESLSDTPSVYWLD